jgi:type II secretory pathway component PulL
MHLNYYKREYTKKSSEVTEIFKKAFPDVENIVDPVTQMKEKLNLLRMRGKRGEGKVIDFIKNLKEDVSAAGDVQITEMLSESGKIRLKGQTRNISSIDSFEKRLRERKYKEVRLTRTQKSLKEEMYEFEIIVEQ